MHGAVGVDVCGRCVCGGDEFVGWWGDGCGCGEVVVGVGTCVWGGVEMGVSVGRWVWVWGVCYTDHPSTIHSKGQI